MIEIQPYTPDISRLWDDFIRESRNATFLHQRGYMDYHADRFSDHSLIARDGHGHIMALLPACADGDTLYSHRGLTYGGWLLPPRRCDALDMLEITDALLAYMRAGGLRRLVYKPVPHIYHSRPAEEDLYALVRAGAQLTGANVSSVIDLDNPLPFDQGSRQRARKAANLGIVCSPSDDWDGFWHILTELLASRYGAAPVHTLGEIQMLASRFPANIRLYTATLGGELLAGIVIYDTGMVAHSQYTAATPRGKELSAVTALYAHLIEEYTPGHRYFDFGTSNEADAPGGVNPGLLRQKCSYGARAILYPTCTLTV
ncbi:MAG: GNAT family N-acetyltransferase [Muribaculaceae bacterium]